jgi:hypothetical protein
MANPRKISSSGHKPFDNKKISKNIIPKLIQGDQP